MITPAALRELADLLDQGLRAEYVGVGDEITVVTDIPAAVEWMRLCPNDRLPVSGVLVDVRPVEVPVSLAEVPC